MYGLVEIDGQKYVERFIAIPQDVTISQGLIVMMNQRIVLPGIAPFLLKGWGRSVIAAAAPATNAFRFKFGNSDGGTWYTTAGVGGLNDRVMDTLIFGTGQFPFPVIPHIWYGANSAITYEIEDISNAPTYIIHMVAYGSFLLPYQG